MTPTHTDTDARAHTHTHSEWEDEGVRELNIVSEAAKRENKTTHSYFNPGLVFQNTLQH